MDDRDVDGEALRIDSDRPGHDRSRISGTAVSGVSASTSPERPPAMKCSVDDDRDRQEHEDDLGDDRAPCRADDAQGPTSAIDNGRLVAAIAAAAATWIRNRPVALRNTPSAVEALMTQARRPRTRRSPRVGTAAVPASQLQTNGPTATTRNDTSAVPLTAKSAIACSVCSAHDPSPRSTASVYAGHNATVTRLTAAGASIRIRYGSANCGRAPAPSSCEITNASDS